MSNRLILCTLFLFANHFCIERASAQADSVLITTKDAKKQNVSLSDTSDLEQDYFGETIIYYTNRVYQKNIKTVQLYDPSYPLSSPIIQLGTEQKLKLSFDDLDGGLKNFSYTLIHCNQNWEPSNLSTADYTTGFTNDVINDYNYSLNSTQRYTHYNVTFPNEYVQITKSGNYIVKVYEDNNPDKLVLTERLMVYEQKVAINALIKPATTVAYRNYKQEIDFSIDYTGYDIQNPYADLKVVITQNDRTDNAIKNLKPQFIKENVLTYDYDEENVFTGGSEFRYIDLKTLRFQNDHIQKISFDSSRYHVYLVPDEKRTFKRYTTSQDINGKYLVKMNGAYNSEQEADYAFVHFFLNCNEELNDGSLYIAGELSNWQFNKAYRMNYNAERLGYEATLYLKQGYYNYEYVFFKNGSNIGDETIIEGMHFETENDYAIYVYHRSYGAGYDQLIGVKKMNSLRSGRN